MSAKIAVVGMGQMGSAMARCLAGEGHDIAGYDIDAAVRANLTNEGLTMADSLVEALAGRKIVLTSLPDPDAVLAAWLGETGIVAQADPGSVILELSTIDPETMKTVAAAAAERGLSAIDCPVSGSPAEAAIGKLVLLVGAEEAAIETIEPILLVLGETWKHTGPVGSAKVVKIVNNMMSMGNVLIAAEAFAVGVAAGVEPQKLFDVISVSGGRSHHFTKRFPNAIKGDFSPGFKMELGEKDLSLAVALGRSLKLPTPAASMVREMFALALAQGHRGQDIVSLLAMYQNWTHKND